MWRYPSQVELKALREWDTIKDMHGFLDFFQEIWEGSCSRAGRKLLVNTQGWSGNEDIINAMQDNLMFWSRCWQITQAGGHYVFEIPEEK